MVHHRASYFAVSPERAPFRLPGINNFRALPRHGKDRFLVVIEAIPDFIREDQLRGLVQAAASAVADPSPIAPKRPGRDVAFSCDPFESLAVRTRSTDRVLHVAITHRDPIAQLATDLTILHLKVESIVIRALARLKPTSPNEAISAVWDALEGEELDDISASVDAMWASREDRSLSLLARLTDARSRIERLAAMRRHVARKVADSDVTEHLRIRYGIAHGEIDQCSAVEAARINSYLIIQQQEQMERLSSTTRLMEEHQRSRERRMSLTGFALVPPALYVAALSYADAPGSVALATRWITVIIGIACWALLGLGVGILFMHNREARKADVESPRA